MKARYAAFQLLTMVLLSGVLPLRAGTFSFAGTLEHRDDVAMFQFTLDSDGQVTLRTSSYASGGFDPALAIFASESPQFLLTLDDSEHCGAADPVTGLCLDSEFDGIALPAGVYLVTLTQSDHLPVGPTLSDGFTPGTEFGPTPFVDFTGSTRTGDWTIEIVGASSAAEVPEPAGGALLLIGVAVVARRAIPRR